MIAEMEAKKRRDNNSIMVSDEALQAVQDIVGDFGVRITKKDLVERLLFWMRDQPDAVRGTILGILPASHRVDIARRELERMANPDADPAQAARAMAKRVVNKVLGGRRSPGTSPAPTAGLPATPGGR